MLHDAALDELTDESRNLNDLVATFMAQVPSFWTPEGLTALRADGAGLAAGPPPEGVTVTERTIPGPDGPVPVRVLTGPRTDAVHLHLHGGGWCIGSAEGSDRQNGELALAAGCAVVSVDYRLAPEATWPACRDDCTAVAEWLLEHATDEWGTARLSIGGGSAGAHLSVVTLLAVRDRLGPEAVGRFAAALLDAGCYDLGFTPSARTSDDALVIPRDTLDACVAHLVPGLDAEARRTPELSPLYADLTGLPPALLTVGTLDPLLDDSLFLAARWQAAGNDAELAVYPESIHGFTAFPTGLARHARARAAAFLQARITA